MLLQHTSLSPDGKLLIIVGDNPEGMLVDSNSGKVIIYTFVNIFFSFFGKLIKNDLVSTDACISGCWQ